MEPALPTILLSYGSKLLYPGFVSFLVLKSFFLPVIPFLCELLSCIHLYYCWVSLWQRLICTGTIQGTITHLMFKTNKMVAVTIAFIHWSKRDQIPYANFFGYGVQRQKYRCLHKIVKYMHFSKFSFAFPSFMHN